MIPKLIKFWHSIRVIVPMSFLTILELSFYRCCHPCFTFLCRYFAHSFPYLKLFSTLNNYYLSINLIQKKNSLDRRKARKTDKQGYS